MGLIVVVDDVVPVAAAVVAVLPPVLVLVDWRARDAAVGRRRRGATNMAVFRVVVLDGSVP